MTSMKLVTDVATVEAFLARSVENVFPSVSKLSEALTSGNRLTVYVGVDPTGPSLHLGHAIELRKLAELQRMGHRVILLIGDFTATIGDPTDKMAVRKQLTREEVLENCKAYKKQASILLDFDGPNAVEMRFNSDWLGKMNFAEVLELASQFTVQQMAERDMFAKRLAEGKPVHLHEFLYPLMQGYDSVAMDVDLEIGGNDQTFNMLAGRDLQRSLKNREKFVLACKLLTDTTGKKMGKTEGNMITLADAPTDMFGKVMSWTDGMIIPGFELCTNVSMHEIREMAAKMSTGENPMPFKLLLAKEIVTALVSAQDAEIAAVHFSTVHQKQEIPDDIPEVSLAESMNIIDALVYSKLVSSKSEARRQLDQGAIKVDHTVVDSLECMVKPGQILQKGKRFFVRLV